MKLLRALAAAWTVLCSERGPSASDQVEARLRVRLTPAYAPGNPNTCPGCASAISTINNNEAPALFCSDCGTWWAHWRHGFFYPANPASSCLTKH